MKPNIRVNGVAWEGDLESIEQSASLIEVEPGVYSILYGGRSFRVRVDGTRVAVDGHCFDVEIADPREISSAVDRAGAHGRVEITAPMPGKVIRLLVAQGEQVTVGQGVIVVEAMKMQNEMTSPCAGRVTQMRVQAGAAVAAGDILAVIE